MTAYDDLIVSDGPIAYWPLHTNTNALVGPNPTTIGWGGATPAQELVTGPTSVGGATRFRSAESDDLQVNNAVLQQSGTSQTIEVWMRHDPGITGTDEIIYKWNSRGCGLLFLATSGNLRYFYFSGTTQRNLDYSPLNRNCFDGYWHHIVGMYDSAAAIGKLYIDGARIQTGTSATLSFLASTASIGASSTPNQYYNGDMAGLAIYSKALTDAEVIEHYEAGFADATDNGSDPTLASRMRVSVRAEERAGSFMPIVAPEDPEDQTRASVTVLTPSLWQDIGVWPDQLVKITDDVVVVIGQGGGINFWVSDMSNNQFNLLATSTFNPDTLAGEDVTMSSMVKGAWLSSTEFALIWWTYLPTVRMYVSTFTYTPGTFTFAHDATTMFAETMQAPDYSNKEVIALDQDTILYTTKYQPTGVAHLLGAFLFQRSGGVWSRSAVLELAPREVTRHMIEHVTVMLDTNTVLIVETCRVTNSSVEVVWGHTNLFVVGINRGTSSLTVHERRIRRSVGAAGQSDTNIRFCSLSRIEPNLFWLCLSGSQYDQTFSNAYGGNMVLRMNGVDLQIIGKMVFNGTLGNSLRMSLPMRNDGIAEILTREYETNPEDALDPWGYADIAARWLDVDSEGKSREVGSRVLNELGYVNYFATFSDLELTDDKSMCIFYRDYNAYNNYGYGIIIVDSS